MRSFLRWSVISPSYPRFQNLIFSLTVNSVVDFLTSLTLDYVVHELGPFLPLRPRHEGLDELEDRHVGPQALHLQLACLATLLAASTVVASTAARISFEAILPAGPLDSPEALLQALRDPSCRSPRLLRLPRPGASSSGRGPSWRRARRPRHSRLPLPTRKSTLLPPSPDRRERPSPSDPLDETLSSSSSAASDMLAASFVTGVVQRGLPGRPFC